MMMPPVKLVMLIVPSGVAMTTGAPTVAAANWAAVTLTVPKSILARPFEAVTCMVPVAIWLPSFKLPVAKPASLTLMLPAAAPLLSVMTMAGLPLLPTAIVAVAVTTSPSLSVKV